MIIVNVIAFILAMIGCLNWGLVGIFNWNLVSAIFGAGMNVGSSIIYVLVLLSAIWLIIVAISNKWYINLCSRNEQK